MTLVLKRLEYRNTNDNATIVIEQYADKFCPTFWRTYIVYDGHHNCVRINDTLLHKPNARQIRNYQENY